MSILKVQNLTKQYPGFVLDGVSFSLAAGRIMGLIGTNGAGKTTTMKAMLGLVPPNGGTIEMLGRPFAANEAACKQELGVVFGGAAYYTQKKLRTITAVTRRFYKNWDEAAYQKYLALFNLEESKKLGQLSEGMKVKYAIAIALSHGARLLVLDEPTSGLDPVSRDDLLEIFRLLVANGQRSILFSTHITSDLEKCADDITYIMGGRVLATDTQANFIKAFAHLKTADDKSDLTLEEIMIRTERSAYDDKAFV